MANEKIVDALSHLVVPIDSVSPDPANVRKHPERNLEAIRGSLRKFGQQKPIVVNEEGVILAGNGLYEAAKSLGWEKIAAVRSPLTGVDAAAYAIADNRTAELAEWDEEQLGVHLTELREAEFELDAIGFTPEEIQALLGDTPLAEGQTDDDAVPEPPDDPVTQRGDLWILGNHRLLCGDAGKTEDVDRLLDGAVIHLVNTDPPYGVKVEPRSSTAIAAGQSSFPDLSGKMHHQGFDVARGVTDPGKARKKMRPKDRPLEGDFLPEDEFVKLLEAWFGQIARVLQPGGTFYIWGGYANCANYPPVLRACKLYFSQAIIWVKEHPVLTRKDFMGNHEWCFYGWKEGAAHRFFGPPNVTDVWSVKKVNPQSMVHLTEKPVELALRALQYSSQEGENVLDLFGGSGSTLIACEKAHRRCYTMEIDPLYCDVIVQRWEEFTDKKAERVRAEGAA